METRALLEFELELELAVELAVVVVGVLVARWTPERAALGRLSDRWCERSHRRDRIPRGSAEEVTGLGSARTVA